MRKAARSIADAMLIAETIARQGNPHWNTQHQQTQNPTGPAPGEPLDKPSEG